MNWRIVAIGVVVVAAIGFYRFFVVAPQVEPGGDARTPVRIGYQALSGSWVYYVANERLPERRQSIFEEQGLEVESVRFDSSNTAAEAILRKDIVTDSATTMTVLLNIEERSPGTLKCFAFQVHTETQFLESFISRKGAGITGYADLAGKKIGVFPGSLNGAITRLLLKDQLDPDKDVEIVQLTPPIQLQALKAGQVDALISYEPTTSLALRLGVAKLVEDSPWAKRIFEPFPVAAYCMHADYIREQPETAAKIARAWFQAIDYVRTNPAQAAATIPAYTAIDARLAEGLNQPLQQKATEIDRDAVQELADLYLEFGLIAKPIDTSTLYYTPE